MHKEVRVFCEHIREKHPHLFTGKKVLDCGSLDINGNNRYLFTDCEYTGIDLCPGANVDAISNVSKYKPSGTFDVVISTEMLEHDKDWLKSLKNMVRLTNPSGLLLLTAAGKNRPVHGTALEHPKDSPMTHQYYKNITVEMLIRAIDLDLFSWFEISYRKTDIRFAGIKRQQS